MRWCSVDNATPRCVLASSAIRCRFVDRFVRLKVLSRVSRQRFSPHGTPLSSIGALAPAAYASRTMLPPSLQDSLPAGWLAFAGRASTLWIAAKGFRSSILLFWTWPGAREVSTRTSLTSFDHLVSAGEQRRRHFEAKRRRGLQVDHQLEL